MVSSVRKASRMEPRLTPNCSASVRSEGRAWPAGKVPSRISSRMRSAISSATRIFLIGTIRPESRAADELQGCRLAVGAPLRRRARSSRFMQSLRPSLT